MPYNRDQCKLFAAKAARGEAVPDDWRDQCRGITDNMYIVIDSKLQICDKSFQKTPQGYLQLEAIISRSGPQEYLAHELGIFDGDPNRKIMLDRPPEEVTDTHSIASFLNMPITDEHPIGGQVNAENFTELSRGMVLDAGATPSNQVKARLIVQDAQLIKKIEDGKRELSAGYTAEIEFSDDGVTATQRKIRGNHVAFVDAARCGKECSIFDNKPKEEIPMAKMKIKGVEYEIADSVVPAVQSLIDDTETLATQLATATEDTSKVQALADASAAKVTELEGSALTDEQIEQRINDGADARLTVLVAASKFLKDYDPSGKSVTDIKRDVLTDALPNLDLTDKTDAYIDTRFDILVEDGVAGKGQQTLNDGLRHQMGEDTVDINDAVAVARKNKIERGQSAYKKTGGDS